MTHPGIGAVLHMLGGGSEHSASEYYGKTITDAVFSDDKLTLSFDDGKKIQIEDDGHG